MNTKPKPARWHCLAAVTAALVCAGCANLAGNDALRVNLAGVEPLPSEGLEVRMLVKLRVQNPNDVAVPYDGVAFELELRGLDFASGVSDARGTVPRFGEAVLAVPVTVSGYAVARQAYSFAMGDRSKVGFVLRGKLGGSGFGGLRFESSGQRDLPVSLSNARPQAPGPN